MRYCTNTLPYFSVDPRKNRWIILFLLPYQLIHYIYHKYAVAFFFRLIATCDQNLRLIVANIQQVVVFVRIIGYIICYLHI